MHEFDLSGFPDFSTDLPAGFRVSTFADARIPNRPQVKQEDIPLEGKTLEDLILELDEQNNRPSKIWSFDIAEGTHKILGQEVRFQSEPFNRSGLIFPDGVVMSREEVGVFFPGEENARMRGNIADHETHVVMLWNGGMNSFDPQRDKAVSIQQLKAKRGKK